MTIPFPLGSSGAAANAAKRVPSAEVRTRSSYETAAPAMIGIGGDESRSKHTTRGRYPSAAAFSAQRNHRARMVTQTALSSAAATPVGKDGSAIAVGSFVFGSIRHSVWTRAVAAQTAPAPNRLDVRGIEEGRKAALLALVRGWRTGLEP